LPLYSPIPICSEEQAAAVLAAAPGLGVITFSFVDPLTPAMLAVLLEQFRDWKIAAAVVETSSLRLLAPKATVTELAALVAPHAIGARRRPADA
jgi:predicted cobalt transporter CbtA